MPGNAYFSFHWTKRFTISNHQLDHDRHAWQYLIGHRDIRDIYIYIYLDIDIDIDIALAHVRGTKNVGHRRPGCPQYETQYTDDTDIHWVIVASVHLDRDHDVDPACLPFQDVDHLSRGLKDGHDARDYAVARHCQMRYFSWRLSSWKWKLHFGLRGHVT